MECCMADWRMGEAIASSGYRCQIERLEWHRNVRTDYNWRISGCVTRVPELRLSVHQD